MPASVYTLSYAESNVFTDPPNVITVPANTATEVLKNEFGTGSGEISQRLIQNTGVNTLYYSENLSDKTGNPQCDATSMYHGQLAAGQQLDCSAHKCRVCVFSVGGTTVSTTIRRRRNLEHPPTVTPAG